MLKNAVLSKFVTNFWKWNCQIKGYQCERLHSLIHVFSKHPIPRMYQTLHKALELQIAAGLDQTTFSHLFANRGYPCASSALPVYMKVVVIPDGLKI